MKTETNREKPLHLKWLEYVEDTRICERKHCKCNCVFSGMLINFIVNKQHCLLNISQYFPFLYLFKNISVLKTENSEYLFSSQSYQEKLTALRSHFQAHFITYLYRRISESRGLYTLGYIYTFKKQTVCDKSDHVNKPRSVKYINKFQVITVSVMGHQAK